MIVGLEDWEERETRAGILCRVAYVNVRHGKREGGETSVEAGGQ